MNEPQNCILKNASIVNSVSVVNSKFCVRNLESRKMSKSINLQDLVKHIVNGTFEQKFCRICLLPLEDLYEDAFTTVCKENIEYCIADILEIVCHIRLSAIHKFKICPSCFITASEAYKFYLLTQKSENLLNFYVDELNNQINSIEEPEKLAAESLCITLPSVQPDNFEYDFDIDKFPFQSCSNDKNLELYDKHDMGKANVDRKMKIELKVEDDFEENILIIMGENGEPSFYKPQEDGTLMSLESSQNDFSEVLKQIPETSILKKKKKRKRNPMEYKMCSRCPVRYRFVRKLKEHMKEEHGVDLFVCKVCQAIIEDEQEFNNHLQTHTGIHTCAICNTVFKKRETIIAHFKWHEEMKNMSKLEGAHICEICGLILKSAEHLKEHNDKKHVKKYTCYYCGRMYKGEISFEMHIKKHEMNNDVKRNPSQIKNEGSKKKRKYTCPTCGRDFVDERALLWHERLHTNERPYVCDVCGRGFVSLNRRNQHAVCAHTAPARRCPLCPALFHLRSMVNTHIKKVHLKAHKRRNRTSKHQNVFWKTETVPIQELSVSIQNEILELQAAHNDAIQTPKW
ncbi:zinc finger protein 484-like isoform X1 [Vanessa cardui]|uniref:zinc finger protein 484-like isoform X1 n=2 Tax=Vanessa cardui TaxID=171605 RepID=UPI001F132021|nr:zinc finger protein 484-like isoform X1 [Vanessa cardui]